MTIWTAILLLVPVWVALAWIDRRLHGHWFMSTKRKGFGVLWWGRSAAAPNGGQTK